MIDHAKVLKEGEELLRELERREVERAARRRGQKHFRYVDARGVEWSTLVQKATGKGAR